MVKHDKARQNPFIYGRGRDDGAARHGPPTGAPRRYGWRIVTAPHRLRADLE